MSDPRRHSFDAPPPPARYEIFTPLKLPFASRFGVQFHNGVGYTNDETAVNLCRTAGYDVVDRQAPAKPPRPHGAA